MLYYFISVISKVITQNFFILALGRCLIHIYKKRTGTDN